VLTIHIVLSILKIGNGEVDHTRHFDCDRLPKVFGHHFIVMPVNETAIKSHSLESVMR
jgi:hypothetical protein